MDRDWLKRTCDDEESGEETWAGSFVMTMNHVLWPSYVNSSVFVLQQVQVEQVQLYVNLSIFYVIHLFSLLHLMKQRHYKKKMLVNIKAVQPYFLCGLMVVLKTKTETKKQNSIIQYEPASLDQRPSQRWAMTSGKWAIETVTHRCVLTLTNTQIYTHSDVPQKSETHPVCQEINPELTQTHKLLLERACVDTQSWTE